MLKSLSPRTRVMLGVASILILVVLAFFAPREGESNNVTGDQAPTGVTVTVTNPVGTLVVNHSVDFSGVQISVTKVEEATAFSDDRKRGGVYTVRVRLREKNVGQSPIGIDYASNAHLLLPDGQLIAPKFVALSPAVLPNSSLDGFFDFPVSEQIALTSLTLRLGSATSVAFSGS